MDRLVIPQVPEVVAVSDPLRGKELAFYREVAFRHRTEVPGWGKALDVAPCKAGMLAR